MQFKKRDLSLESPLLVPVVPVGVEKTLCRIRTREFHADVGVLKSIARMNIKAGRRDWSGVECACGKGDGVKVVGGDG